MKNFKLRLPLLSSLLLLMILAGLSAAQSPTSGKPAATPVIAAQIRRVSEFATLEAAAAAIGATAGADLEIDAPVAAGGSFKLPKNISLKFTGTGSVSIPDQVVLTIAGNIEAAPDRKIFIQTGTGKVDLYDSTVLDIYPEWWGARTNDGADDLTAFQAAVDSGARLGNKFFAGGGGLPREIRLEAGNYNFSDALVVKSQIHLEGAGADPYGKGTWINVAAGKPGIKFLYRDSPEPMSVSTASIVEHLTIIGGRRDNAFRAENSGIIVNSKVELENVESRNFEGNGFSVIGTGAPDAVANLFRVINCAAYTNNGDGIYVTGNDANAGLVEQFNASENRGWGVNDNSFLGNTYIACHTRDNLKGSYQASGLIADNLFLGCYAESGQPPASLSRATIALGGTLESGVKTSGFHMRAGMSGGGGFFSPFRVAAAFSDLRTSAQLFVGQPDNPNLLFGWTSPSDAAFAGDSPKYYFARSYLNNGSYSLTSEGGHLLNISTYKYAGNLFPGSPVVQPTLTFPDGFIVGSSGLGNLGASGDYVKLKSTTAGVLEITATQSVNINGTPVIRGASGAATLDFQSIAAGGQADLKLTVAGAVTGDAVTVSSQGAPETGLIWNAFVSAPDTVTVRMSNITGAIINPAPRSFKAVIVK